MKNNLEDRKVIITYIYEHWVEWLFAIVIAVLGVGYRLIIKRMKEESLKSAAQNAGIQALLRDRIIQAHNYYLDKGYCPIYAKENVKRMYDAYHALGGNDVATHLKDEMIDMPTERKDEDDEE